MCAPSCAAGEFERRKRSPPGSDSSSAQEGHVGDLGCRREQRLELVELCLGRVVARETGGAFELDDHRIERAVLVMRRAEIAQAGMGSVRCCSEAQRSDATCRCPARPRAAPPGLRRSLPAASAAAAARLPPRARRAASAAERRASKRLSIAALANDAPGRCGSAKPSSASGRVLELEQPADQPVRASAMTTCRARPAPAAARRGSGSRRRRRAPVRLPSPIRSPTTTSPVAMPTRTRRSCRAGNRPTASIMPARRAPPARHHPHAPADSRNRPAPRRPCTWRRSHRNGRPSATAP